MTPSVLCIALITAGFCGGAAYYSVRSPAPIERAGRPVVRADLHVHSWSADGALSPAGLALLARHQGIDAFALTNHNQVLVARVAAWISARMGGPMVLIGEEITSPGFHVIGIGLTRRIAWDQPPDSIIHAIHDQGGIAIAAHPTGAYRRYGPAAGELDATEVMHPMAFRSMTAGAQMRAFYDSLRASGHAVAAVGSSDYHWRNRLGLPRTYVFPRDRSARGIIEAVRDGRTVVMDANGTAVGDSALVTLLLREPLPDRGDHSPRRHGLADGMAQVAGWVGFAGLALLRRRRRGAFIDAGTWAKDG